jgi:long-chain-fatty-acid--CoA ligase ACSBG
LRLCRFEGKCEEDTVEGRQLKQKPGKCATFIYTSGTTGMPKAVMVNHDGYNFLSEAIIQRMRTYSTTMDGNGRMLSYLPLSHVAGQILDLIIGVKSGFNLFFAHPSVLQGAMPKYLLACRPYAIPYPAPPFWESPGSGKN